MCFANLGYRRLWFQPGRSFPISLSRAQALGRIWCARAVLGVLQRRCVVKAFAEVKKEYPEARLDLVAVVRLKRDPEVASDLSLAASTSWEWLRDSRSGLL